jgi:hypothetical protein
MLVAADLDICKTSCEERRGQNEAHHKISKASQEANEEASHRMVK